MKTPTPPSKLNPPENTSISIPAWDRSHSIRHSVHQVSCTIHSVNSLGKERQTGSDQIRKIVMAGWHALMSRNRSMDHKLNYLIRKIRTNQQQLFKINPNTCCAHFWFFFFFFFDFFFFFFFIKKIINFTVSTSLTNTVVSFHSWLPHPVTSAYLHYYYYYYHHHYHRSHQGVPRACAYMSYMYILLWSDIQFGTPPPPPT